MFIFFFDEFLICLKLFKTLNGLHCVRLTVARAFWCYRGRRLRHAAGKRAGPSEQAVSFLCRNHLERCRAAVSSCSTSSGLYEHHLLCERPTPGFCNDARHNSSADYSYFASRFRLSKLATDSSYFLHLSHHKVASTCIFHVGRRRSHLPN